MSLKKVVANLLPKTVAKAAEFYASQYGWRVFPLYEVDANGHCVCSKGTECPSPGKHPRITVPKGADSVHPATNEVETVKKWWAKWPNANIGVWLAGSEVAVIDIDKNEKKDGFKGMAEIMAHAEKDWPKTLICNTPSGGKHLYFELCEGLPNKANALGPGIDIWHTLHYVIVPPSNHWTKGIYQWDTSAGDAPIPFPEWLKPSDKIEAAQRAAAGQAPKKGAGRPKKERLDPNDPHDVERLAHALKYVDNTDRDRWVMVGFAMARAFDWSEEGFKVYDTWASSAHNYDPKKTAEQYYEQSKHVATNPITCASIFEWAALDPNYVPLKKLDDRHLVRFHPANKRETLGDLCQYLGEFPIYQRGAQLVEIVPVNQRMHDAAADTWYPEGSFVLRQVDAGQLAVRILPERIRWERFTEQNGWRACGIEMHMVEALLGIGNWPTSNNLRAFVEHPTLRDDGSIVSARGYDARSGLFITENVDIKLQKPTKKEAIKAAKYLLHPFEEYKWLDGKLSLSVLLAAILTVGVRHLFTEGVPFFTIEAPVPGSGKSKLAKAISILWYGHGAATTPYSSDPEELRKHLMSILLGGARIVLFDNIHPGIKVNDPTLNQLITSGTIRDRILGASEEVTVSSSATFFATGNRMKVVGDMLRRTLRMQVDPEGVHPHLRKFKIDPLEGYVAKHRAKLITAALTILSAFFKAGKPKATGKKEPPLASFEQWSNIIRECVVWVGMPDIKDSISQSFEGDDESADMEHLLRELYTIPALVGTGLTSAMLLPIVLNNKPLQEAVAPFISVTNHAGLANPKVLTAALKQVIDIPVDGKKLVRAGSFFQVREAA